MYVRGFFFASFMTTWTKFLNCVDCVQHAVCPVLFFLLLTCLLFFRGTTFEATRLFLVREEEERAEFLIVHCP